MRWFRLYSEARNDAKLRYLSDAEFRIWFNLLCLANEQKDRGVISMSHKLLAIEVSGGDEELLTATLEKLTELSIIAEYDDGLEFINFKKRQYDKPSDMPEATRERKRKSRQKQDEDKTVTPMSRPCHALSRVYTDTDSTNTSLVPPLPPLPQNQQDEPGEACSTEDVVQFYLNNISPTASPYQIQQLTSWIEDDGMEPGLVMYAMEQALSYDKRNLRYIQAILQRLLSEGITTRAAAEYREAQRKEAKIGAVSGNTEGVPVVTDPEAYLREVEEARARLEEMEAEAGYG